jgi:dienelactone hydrolase
MIEQKRWSQDAAIPIFAGATWLWFAASFGLIGFLFSLIPGCLLLASGFSILLWPGDLRISSFAALGGLLGVPLAIPAFWVAGPGTALLLIGLSAASYIAAGAVAVKWEPHTQDVPAPEPSLRLSAEVAADEVVLATMLTGLPVVSGGAWSRVRDEVIAARDLFESRGWLARPADYHVAPPPLEAPSLTPARTRGIEYEHLRFESGYAPHEGEAGRDRWLAYEPNRTAHAWVLRHAGPPRPWLVCIHGFQLGWPMADFALFDPRHFHHELGLNLVYPILPFHGKRKVGRRSGDGFLTGDVLDSVHAEAQAMWDIRRLLAWVRGQDAPAVGVFGISLGGYQASLLTGLDPDLACVIAGVPLTDIPRALWRHGPPLLIRHGETQGVQRDEVSEVMNVVSPLSLDPRVPVERRFLIGGVADRLVPPDQVRDLWRHWDRPRIAWYQGAHLTFNRSAEVRRLIKDALATGGLTRPTEVPASEPAALRDAVG